MKGTTPFISYSATTEDEVPEIVASGEDVGSRGDGSGGEDVADGGEEGAVAEESVAVGESSDVADVVAVPDSDGDASVAGAEGYDADGVDRGGAPVVDESGIGVDVADSPGETMSEAAPDVASDEVGTDVEATGGAGADAA